MNYEELEISFGLFVVSIVIAVIALLGYYL